MLDLEELKLRINPKYAHTEGTESFERRLCVEEIESLRKQLAECQRERDEYKQKAIEALLKLVEEQESISSRVEYTFIEQQLEAAKLDAERYRWLRDYMNSPRTDFDDLIVAACCNDNPEEFDQAIDAARKEPTC